MSAPITITIDIEDHRPSPDREARYVPATEALLEHLRARGYRATVFVVGEIARNCPELVQSLAEDGHEIGLHGFRHWATFAYEPDTFATEVLLGRKIIEDLTGRAVRGYRAPAATLMPRSLWATEVLADAGFDYSASILPAQTYVVGFRGAPTTPFRWPSGLVELPCPAVSFAGVGMPFLGGTFLRVLPEWLIHRCARHLRDDGVAWSYLHPYDADPAEPFWIVPEVHWWGSLLLWVNRGVVLDRLDRLVEGRVGEPLGARVDALPASLPTWDPATADDRAVRAGVVTLLERRSMVERMARRNDAVTTDR